MIDATAVDDTQPSNDRVGFVLNASGGTPLRSWRFTVLESIYGVTEFLPGEWCVQFFHDCTLFYQVKYSIVRLSFVVVYFVQVWMHDARIRRIILC